MKNIIVIGGGPGGMMAAGAAAENGANVILLEKNAALGKKLALTGGRRCNITNTDDVMEMLHKVPRNPNFLYSALYNFDSAAICDFLAAHGIATVVEDAGRVFPIGGADAVVDLFVRYLRQSGVDVLLNAHVKRIVPRGTCQFMVALADGREIAADAVVLATGGLAASHTGASGDGYALARALGHDFTKLYPSVVPLVADEPRLMGLSLADVGLMAKRDGRVVYKDFGGLLFTHFGLSGPVVLRASAHLAQWLHLEHEFLLDFAPWLSESELDGKILGLFAQNPNKDAKNCLEEILPGRLLSVLLEIAGIGEGAKAREVARQARRALCGAIKSMGLRVTGTAGFEAAVVTCGGVRCDEINPATMQSRIVRGLYFAGEIIDVDALSGGYNLSIALATGRLAGESAAKDVAKND